MIFVSGAALGQLNPVISRRYPATSSLHYTPSFYRLTDLKKNNVVLPAGLPGDYYAKQLGFFCRQEIRLERVTKIPFRFRLGSVEQCDRLEGKRIALSR